MAMLTSGILVLTASAALVPAHPVRVAPHQRERLQPVPVYQDTQMEAYLTAEQAQWIRPGFNVTIDSLTIPADRRPVVELTFRDDRGQLLDRAGNVTPGPISLSFVLAVYDGQYRQYTSYTRRFVTSPITGVRAEQASADSGGAWTDLSLGKARYRFGTTLPEDFDRTRTHTLHIYGNRNLLTIINKRYIANVEYDFRPDGGAVTEVWQAMTDGTCNTCHDPLALHGGQRVSVKGCVTCHSPQTTDPDTGNTVDMKVMIHKIHRGANLPSVLAGTPYIIIGNQQSVHDYSHVVHPQDIRNCTTCHPASSPEGDIWYTRPTRAACGSCHDHVDWVTGENHIAGPQFDDSACASCHQPEGEFEFDASIKGAHTIPRKSTQLAGLNLEILSVTNAVPGEPITVTFRVTNGDGSFVEPASLNSFNLLLGGPYTEYTTYLRQNARIATSVNGVSTVTFTTPLPADASGTWVLSSDTYRNVTINPGTPKAVTFREVAKNPMFPVPVTDQQAINRRIIVTEAKCNACHELLALHGQQRITVDQCMICHKPDETDIARRPAGQLPAESVHMKFMIHRIHKGEDLEYDYTVYGFGGTPYTFNHVLYPGDLRNCQACHVAGSYSLPTPPEALPTTTLRDFFTPMLPGAAACLSCHDSLHAAAHAYVNTAPFGESCASCHGTNREFAVEKVHAR